MLTLPEKKDEAKELESQTGFTAETEKQACSKEPKDHLAPEGTVAPEQLPTNLSALAHNHPSELEANNFAHSFPTYASYFHQNPVFGTVLSSQRHFPCNFLNHYGLYDQHYPGSIPTAGLVTPLQDIVPSQAPRFFQSCHHRQLVVLCPLC